MITPKWVFSNKDKLFAGANLITSFEDFTIGSAQTLDDVTTMPSDNTTISILIIVQKDKYLTQYGYLGQKDISVILKFVNLRD